MTRLKLLGHVVSNQGQVPDPDKCAAIINLSFPRKLKDLQKFIVVVDGFSKYVVAKATRRSTADVTTAVLREIFLQYGFPKLLTSDNCNGSAFRAQKLADFLMAHGVKAIFTSNYNPKSNMSERNNQNIKTNLTAIMKEYGLQHKMWSNMLPYVVYNYNRTFHNTIQCTPAVVFFGRELYVFIKPDLQF
ncbi:uncharacterized protein LOC123302544 [Chrysoperla carnea]|uniref:uncharacterized protein LOC123302544 n=1 Tax=Chrysoperla carnea TaxID=189513 RepID=UPI001D071665|nr:uncharacterized protein LOC123302544 [Chrysoperla carnea]